MEAWTGPEPERALELFSEDAVLDVSIRPDGRVWRGREGVRQAMTEWTGAWEGWHVEVHDYVDAGEGRVVTVWTESGRGKGSGAAMHQEGASLMTVRDGQIVSAVLYLDREEAFADAGLAQ
jgi:ketosteroid isomerase-like protein